MITEIIDYAANAVTVSWEQMVEASRADEEIQQILDIIERDKRDELPIEFRVFANELCQVGDLLLRGDRIVVPTALRFQFLKIAHEGHLGSSMMKSTLRLSLWWPRMDREVENFVRNCRGCILVAAPDAPEPMTRKQLPDGPWKEIAIDFLGPLPEGQWLFVVVDYYSRFVEVVEMWDITASNTIRELSTMFGRFGVPITMRADNGPQLGSECKEPKAFCKEFDITLVNTIPYWPQANGEVERQNRSILERLRISQELGKDWRLELRKYLLAYHSTTHPTTGSPSKLLFGRRIRNKLPSIPEREEDEMVRDRDKIVKEKGKVYSGNKRRARRNEIKNGDLVYVKRQRKDNKLATDYSSELFKVVKRKESEVTVKSLNSGNEYKRYVSHLKKAEAQVQDAQRREDKEDQPGTSVEQERSDENNFSKSVSEGHKSIRVSEDDTSVCVPEKRRWSAPKKFQDYAPF
ncbi:uncharacterized protein K02A2.6-like [Wyeomyia smithii]|uniref:uncharacterized protein K02A2.6-like n=1 Tax=Wyeomyia smithii TaxID=174621 RepID=UPI002467E459|nr:uncharacterized protein K02A2.6-like [Wyeomyia smithii]